MRVATTTVPLALLAACVAAGAGPGAGPAPGPRSGAPGTTTTTPQVSVLLLGEPALVDPLAAALPRVAIRGVLITPATLPEASTAAADPGAADAALDAALASARTAYIAADFAACQAALAGDDLVPSLLASGRRPLAARVLFWRAACHAGASDTAAADAVARELAGYGLDLPADVEAASPDVEARLAARRAEVATLPHARLRVDAAPTAAIAVDGRDPVCKSPCSFDLPPGAHVVAATAPGFARAWTLTHLDPGGGSLRLELAEAAPDEAARQFRALHAGGGDVEGAVGVALLARATHARRVALVLVDRDARGPRLRGTLGLDGLVAARAERRGADAAALTALLRDLLVRGRVVAGAPPVWKRWELWVGVGGAALVAAGVTTWLLFEPEIESGLIWPEPRE